MDLKEMVEKAVKKLTSDKDLMKLFQDDPVKALEKVLGVDLPDDMLDGVVAGIKTKLAADKAGDLLGGLKKLF